MISTIQFRKKLSFQNEILILISRWDKFRKDHLIKSLDANLFWKLLCIFIFLIPASSNLFGQANDPIWEVGTKWTYELNVDGNTTTYLVNEIVDTITLLGNKLYVVESEPIGSGVQYFYYEDGKVYNYKEDINLFELLYDFSTEDNYFTDYRPICDPFFAYDSLQFKNYTILVDSISDFVMPDGAIRNVQHVAVSDTVEDGSNTLVFNESPRSILDGVGFLQGAIHNTHDWEIGMYICDDFANFVGKLRCFENDTVSYNFVGYPCDSTWLLSSIESIKEEININLYPNPTSDILFIDGIENDVDYEVYSATGKLLDAGVSSNKSIRLKMEGLNMLRFNVNGSWINKMVTKVE